MKTKNFTLKSLRFIFKKIKNATIFLRIFVKFVLDSFSLPLTKNHWELYFIIHRFCWRELHDFPNLVNCRDFNDRVQWLKLFDQDPEIIRCSDKIAVRDYVREKVGESYLVDLYQIHNHFDEIDFDVLPDAFVIKTNHDSGTVIIVRDKSKFDQNSAKERIEKSLQRPYGWFNGEWAYSHIKSKVFVEQHIDPSHKAPPPDYKFQCVNGRVTFCRYTYDRGIDTKEIVVDRNGVDIGFIIDENFKKGSDFILPSNWGEMIKISELLSFRFKCVRIDLYSFMDQIYVGEMTFFPMAGVYKGDGQKKLGHLLDFDRKTFKPLYMQNKDSV